MDYKYILIGLCIFIVLLVIYKYRNKIKSIFTKKSDTIDKTEPIEKISENVPEIIEKKNKEEFCFLDITVSPKEGVETDLGRILIKLYSEDCPKTCENFKSLCKIEYKNCVIHRLIPGFMFQTGDYENSDGTGGSSMYGKKFSDENLLLQHYKRGIVSMANSGPNTNGSQFFITFKETPSLDEKHVVFGEVVKGFDVLDAIEQIPTDSNDEPKYLLYIKNSGFVTD